MITLIFIQSMWFEKEIFKFEKKKWRSKLNIETAY
jgi:hypothetical protein